MIEYPLYYTTVLSAEAVETHIALWVQATDKATSAAVDLGYWTGGWPITLTLDGSSRSFQPVGEALTCEQLEPSTVIESRRYRVSLVGSADDLSAATRDLELTMAPVRLWRLVADPEDRTNFLSVRRLKGWIDQIELRTAAGGEPSGVDISVATAAEALTWGLADRRFNDATMRRRSASDAFFQYAAIAPEVKRVW